MPPQAADVVVIGGGVVGTSVAFHLCSRRAGRIVLCERRWLAAGATGKSGALVRMHYANEPEARLAAASLPYFQHWGDLVGAGSSGFVNTGMLRFVASAHEAKLRANVAMLRRIGVNTSVVGPDDVRAVAPSWRTDDIVAAAYEPDSGMADPVATTHGFAARAAALGADVRVGTEAHALHVAKGRIEGVDTSGGFIAARAIVVAAGAWALPLLRQVGAAGELTTVRVQVALFRRPPEHAGLHPICIDGANDLWMRPEGPRLAQYARRDFDPAGAAESGRARRGRGRRLCHAGQRTPDPPFPRDRRRAHARRVGRRHHHHARRQADHRSSSRNRWPLDLHGR
jgi:sarcosine oxidase subunit beta